MIHFWQSHLDFGLRLFSAKQAFIWALFLNGTGCGGLAEFLSQLRNDRVRSIASGDGDSVFVGDPFQICRDGHRNTAGINL